MGVRHYDWKTQFTGGIPDKEWNLSTGLPNPIIYISLVVLLRVMFSTKSSLRTQQQKQLSELWQQPQALHHAMSWDILGSYEEMEARLWWLITWETWDNRYLLSSTGALQCCTSWRDVTNDETVT